MKTKKKKGLRRKLKCFSPKLREVKKNKKVFTAIWDYIRLEFVGFIRAGWLLIVSSSSAQISMGGRLNVDWGGAKSGWGYAKSRWGDANSRWGDAPPLQFKYCIL